MDRPYVVLSCAMSLDGYIDDSSGKPLRLSSDEDIDRVDELRAGCDAILVGAGTIRADDPVLLLRSQVRREARVARGKAPDPVRVVLSASGNLDPAARIFTTGTHGTGARGTGTRGTGMGPVVYVPTEAAAEVRGRLGAVADVVAAGDPLALGTVLADLAARGAAKLLVEGGASLHTQFLAGGLADELVLAVAPFFIGDAEAPRFVQPGRFPWNPGHRAALTEVTRAGDMAVLRYALSGRPRQAGPRVMPEG